jgi:hypothetical protein
MNGQEIKAIEAAMTKAAVALNETQQKLATVKVNKGQVSPVAAVRAYHKSAGELMDRMERLRNLIDQSIDTDQV